MFDQEEIGALPLKPSRRLPRRGLASNCEPERGDVGGERRDARLLGMDQQRPPALGRRRVVRPEHLAEHAPLLVRQFDESQRAAPPTQAPPAPH